MTCWGCGRVTGKGRAHARWCPNTGEPPRTYAERQKLAVLIRQQQRDIKLRRYFQPPEHPQGFGRTMSYTAWAHERGGGRFQ